MRDQLTCEALLLAVRTQQPWAMLVAFLNRQPTQTTVMTFLTHNDRS